MGSSAFLAISLDEEQIERIAGVSIQPRTTPDAALPLKSGAAVHEELGGRFLLRYLMASQVSRFRRGSGEQHFTTPTPLPIHDLNRVLHLYRPTQRRRYVMLLDARQIPIVRGPRWIHFGQGIEYLLPEGFPEAAIVVPAAVLEVA